MLKVEYYFIIGFTMPLEEGQIITSIIQFKFPSKSRFYHLFLSPIKKNTNK